MSRKTIITIVTVVLGAVGAIVLTAGERSAACEILCPEGDAAE